MSDAENPFHPLPDAKTFLEGKSGIKPLQHKAAALRQFILGFEKIPLLRSAAQTIREFSESTRNTAWAQMHDAAHEALIRAKILVADSAELSAHAHSIESIFNARAPSAQTVSGLKHPVLEEILKPLTAYLKEFGMFIVNLSGLSPTWMKPKGADAGVTPAQLSNHEHGPDCDHGLRFSTTISKDSTAERHGASCNHYHPAPKPPPSNSGHDHGPGCGHDHAPSSSAGGGAHYHGDTPCSHSHAPSGGIHEPHLPKGKSNAGWWVAGIVATVGVGAYLINEYGKPRKKEIEPKSGDWKDRGEQTATSQARTL
jgi:hypothetical protein